jgi:hypothetical protein
MAAGDIFKSAGGGIGWRGPVFDHQLTIHSCNMKTGFKGLRFLEPQQEVMEDHVVLDVLEKGGVCPQHRCRSPQKHMDRLARWQDTSPLKE